MNRSISLCQSSMVPFVNWYLIMEYFIWRSLLDGVGLSGRKEQDRKYGQK